jgi:hypothetical protein
MSTKEVFTAEDKKAAQRAHATYMYEINGAGLRWEFERRPGSNGGFFELHGSSPRLSC